jgi:predicted alpha/beta superfamily hydrolase
LEHPRYSIIGTESRRLKSKFVDQEFQISVALPVFHGQIPEKKCPVIYMLDANFYFGLVTELTRIMAQCFELPDTVIVGIGYPTTEPAHEAYDLVSGWRTRDLTPIESDFAESEVLKYSPALDHVESGGAGNFLQFILEELIPWVEAEYPAEAADRTLLGHSWGGLFALYALFHTNTFHQYVVCDPDINYEEKVIFEYERDYARTHDTLPANLFISTSEDKSQQKEAFVSILEKRQYKDLAITFRDFRDLRRCEMVGPSFQAGLKAVFS